MTEQDPIEQLRATFGFKLAPADLGDGGMAFFGFLNFATGDSKEARHLQALYFVTTETAPPTNDGPRATAEEVGRFIDYLIERHWGEAAAIGAPKH